MTPLKEYFKQNKVNINALSRELGIHKMTINRALNGLKISKKNVDLICSKLGLSEDLFSIGKSLNENDRLMETVSLLDTKSIQLNQKIETLQRQTKEMFDEIKDLNKLNKELANIKKFIQYQ